MIRKLCKYPRHSERFFFFLINLADFSLNITARIYSNYQRNDGDSEQGLILFESSSLYDADIYIPILTFTVLIDH